MDILKVRRGEIIQADTDIEYCNSLGQKAEVSKGEKLIVGFDSQIHCLKQRMIIAPDDTIEISGYSATGLAEFLSAWLDRNIDLEKTLSHSEYTRDDIKAYMEMALAEIGMEVGNEETAGD